MPEEVWSWGGSRSQPGDVISPDWSGGTGEAVCHAKSIRYDSKTFSDTSPVPPDHSGLIFPDPRFWSWGGSRSDLNILGISARREVGIGPGGWNNCNDTTNQSGALQRHRSVYKIQRTSGSHCRAVITILLLRVPAWPGDSIGW